MSFDVDGRESTIDAVDVTAGLRADGLVHVEQRYTFESADGGTVGVPDLASGVIGGATNVTVDGAPATPTGGTFNAELAVKGKRATVAYDLVGEVDRYADVGVVELDVLPAPADASRQDPDVSLRGTFTIPEVPPGPFEAHLHGGRDEVVTITGSTVEFSAEAPIWMPFHRLAVAFPAGAVPFVDLTPIPYLAQFQATQAVQNAADATTESTLSSVEEGEEIGRWVITAIAFGLPAIFWTIFGLGVLRRLHQRQQLVDDVPDHLSDPPTQADPAVVAVLEGEGSPSRPAIAGTVLALAQRKALDIQKYGDKLVVKVPLTTTANNESERIVLEALRREATPDGVIEGPPVFREHATWWRGFKRDAIKQARTMGLVTRWMPLAPLSGAIVTTAVGAAFFFLTNPAAYAAIIIGTQFLASIISFIGGYTLTNQGWRHRALWHVFAKYIHDQGKLDKDVGPEGVVVWGPYLVYGAVLGEAHAASRPLLP